MEMSASLSLELTKLVVIHPNMIFSQMKSQSTSMCLVLLLKTGFEVVCRAVWLSPRMKISVSTDISILGFYGYISDI